MSITKKLQEPLFEIQYLIEAIDQLSKERETLEVLERKGTLERCLLAAARKLTKRSTHENQA
jgi:hypothetical protein